MIIEILIFALTVLVGYVFYKHKRIKSFFDDHDLKYLPGVPILGNFFHSTFNKTHFLEDLNAIYKAFPGERYVGVIDSKPTLLIRDPEIIKQITVKDFDHFVDHVSFFSETQDPLIGGSLFMMKGDKWRDMRSTLSPAFTGSKMRLMVPFMDEISNNIMKYLLNETNNEPDNTSDIVDANDLMRRYTNDVIASCAFGLQINSLTDKDNDFYKHGQSVGNFTFWQKICMILIVEFPRIAKFFGLKTFSSDTTNFFRAIVTNTIDHREKNNIVRPDMIQLLMEASKGTLKMQKKDREDVGFATTEESLVHSENNSRKWTLDELTAQAFIFFIAGYESSASAIVMAIHELAVNQDVQRKLYDEAKSFHDEHTTFTLDNVQELKYLDMVVNETLRKWSPGIMMDRVCAKPYTLPPPRPGGKPYQLKVGEVVFNMINQLHMDEEHFPEPERFDPERFSEENRQDIKPFTFVPFGVGPRNCIGSRFALLELKILLYKLVLNFEILKCDKTSDPIRLQPFDFNIRADGGTFVRIKARTRV